jgi:LysM repeat protein
MSRGRHKRPSKTSKVIATTSSATTLGAVAVGAVTVSSHGLPAHMVKPETVHVTAAYTTMRAIPPAIHEASTSIVTVKRGDTLSKIAATGCGGQAADWTGIYVANEKTIGPDPDLIEPGQQLVLDCTTATVTETAVVTPESHWHHINHANHMALMAAERAPVYQAPVYHTAPVPAPVQQEARQQVSTAGDGSFQSCVISRESGGNPNVTNASGHYGLYQFSASTWEEYGGSASTFGNASVSEQNQVFQNAMAQGGESNWSPYDGC